MRLEGFGIKLELLTPESAEIVRQWRNRPEILNQMEYTETISQEQQQAWFTSIDPESCQYFLIRSQNEPAGMIHLIRIDHTKKTAEAGLFIGESKFSGTGIALGASLLLLDHAFNNLGLLNIKAKVKNTNTAAQQYNRLLGFKEEMAVNDNFTQYQLSKEAYAIQRIMLEKLIF